MRLKRSLLKPKQKFTYCEYSGTIRLMPQNYMVIRNIHGVFLPDFDGAIKKKMGLRIVKELFYSSKVFRFDLRNAQAIANHLNKVI